MKDNLEAKKEDEDKNDTFSKVKKRTHELAEQAGRESPYVTQEDYEKAKLEITGESDPDLQIKSMHG